MMNALWFALLAATLSWLGSYLVIRRAPDWNLVQMPNHRSSHVEPTPTGGGLGVVLGATVSCTWWGLREPVPLLAALLLAIPLAVVGLMDDRRQLPAKFRFVSQLGVVTLMALSLGSLPALPLTSGLSIAGAALVALVVLAGLWWINLFNFMDGIDGLAGVQAAFMLVSSACLILVEHPGAQSAPLWAAMICVAASATGFLILNWPPARVFMGDIGSTWLAFMIFALALGTVKAGWSSYIIWGILGAVFTVDATTTLAIRVWRGERWYDAHRSHAYQRLARRWHGERKAGHRSVTLLILAINLLWLLPLAWACSVWSEWSWVWLGLAYAPLLVGALMLGAGTSDHG